MKVFNRLKITAEPLFIGHKLKLEQLRKLAKDERHCLYVIKELKENSDIAQFGVYSKGFADALAYYWYIGGRKLTPTIQEINNFIYKDSRGEYKTFEDVKEKDSYLIWKYFR